jgi:pimeloyl-ACP methyl ester carboxylesterase
MRARSRHAGDRHGGRPGHMPSFAKVLTIPEIEAVTHYVAEKRYRALNMSQTVGRVNVPTLYLWGSDDLFLGRGAALDSANYVTGPYRFEELHGRSHWLLEEAPEEVADLLLRHLSEVQ